jgi:hypothetical protein
MTARRRPSQSGSVVPAALELALWVVALVGLLLTWRALHAEPARSSSPAAAWAVSEPATVSEDSLAAAADLVAERDPFRLAHRPASVDFRADVTPGQPVYVMPPAAPRPPLVLKGIVGGPPWQAYLDGVPGRDGGVLVARGDTLSTPAGPLRIRAIGRDTVVVQAADTTWRLTVKRTW